ncbi:amine oxidase [Niabella ginsengisoli]|uniref:Amine oxidase n=1 Tax=Niabella ginsengisoli TaxID=522298 RepID=A0ABS9SKG5_9BACT|nr:amine oxidase [Niabella ginsengisoli]MCH5598835.1 amine oxidase [Niabella ginsengisoli]
MTDINPFKSFWMGGFECSDHLNVHGDRIDLLSLTGHLDQINDDYKLLSTFNISTIREGVRWSQVEYRPFKYRWNDVETIILAAKNHDIQVVYDLCHFGFPDDLSPCHPHFVKRFVRFCESFLTFYKKLRPDDSPIITPINEVSFLAWLGGDVAGTAPYTINMGWQVKYSLMKAYIAGIAAMKAIDPTVRFLSVEPLIHVIPDQTDLLLCKQAAEFNESQFQCLDMLCGKICPELGGKPEYLDIVGLDYYHNSQWYHPSRNTVNWKNQETIEDVKSLSELLLNAYHRYKRPIILSETSHTMEHRSQWISMVTNECDKVMASGVPFWGICIYPLIDRPDWDQLDLWHRSGIWDIDVADSGLSRKLYQPYAETLWACQQSLAAAHTNQNFIMPLHHTLHSIRHTNAREQVRG